MRGKNEEWRIFVYQQELERNTLRNQRREYKNWRKRKEKKRVGEWEENKQKMEKIFDLEKKRENSNQHRVI